MLGRGVGGSDRGRAVGRPWRCARRGVGFGLSVGCGSMRSASRSRSSSATVCRAASRLSTSMPAVTMSLVIRRAALLNGSGWTSYTEDRSTPGSSRETPGRSPPRSPTAPTKYWLRVQAYPAPSPAPSDQHQRPGRRPVPEAPGACGAAGGCSGPRPRRRPSPRSVSAAGRSRISVSSFAPGVLRPRVTGRRDRPLAPRRPAPRSSSSPPLAVDDVGHDRGDVVDAACGERLLDQLVQGLLQVGHPQGFGDRRRRRPARTHRRCRTATGRRPGAARVVRSGSLAGWPLSTLSSSDRCGCTAASASLILPSSTSDCTQLWSWVSRSSRPSRSR